MSRHERDTGFAVGPRRRRTGLLLALAIVLVVAGGAVAAIALLGSGGGTTSVTPVKGPVGSATPPPRTTFAFSVASVRPIALGSRQSKDAATEAADAIAKELSEFYDTAFADPHSWQTGVPDNTWSLFGEPVRDRAKSEANSFTPATTNVNLAKLNVTTSSLRVEVLFDPSGKLQAAFAHVIFEATGEIKGGQTVEVTNAVTFFLQPVSGQWVVTGYPSAKTTVEAGAPSPSSGASQSASPTPGSTP
jgi:hypothetical protein